MPPRPPQHRPVSSAAGKPPRPLPPPVGSFASTQAVLDKPAQFVRGVGPQRAKLLESLGVRTLGDLIEYFPFRYEEQPPPRRIDDLDIGELSTVIAAIERVKQAGTFRNARVQATVRDSTGSMQLLWFNAAYMADKLARGQVVRLYGKIELGEGSLARMVNPSIEWLDPESDPAQWATVRVVPVYRATAGLASRQIARLVDAALAEGLSAIRETLPADLLEARGLLGRAESIRIMHQPTSLAELEPARSRLAFEELFLMQVAVSLQRHWSAAITQAPALPVTPLIDQRIRRRFPFALTPSQEKVVREICADLGRTRPMTRLLQGDVGSGKTIVALYAALVAVANRWQCTILAPTEVLAAQHYASIEKYLEGSRVKRCLLTGRTSTARRRGLLADAASGDLDLVVGTQALLEEKVGFAKLGLVVVDEQHKFGVGQRAALRGKRANPRGAAKVPVPHYLVMTATPIPRTLSMTVFGDLDVSVIDRLPPGRQPIATRLVEHRAEGRAWPEVARHIAAGEQVYVVSPQIEETQGRNVRAATSEFERVRGLLPGARVGLLHGRLAKDEKSRVMAEFKAGRLDVLVSTTVIEVGVDVPNATVMVIQNAERFGLAALHQLRGRVGRGTRPSLCLLMADQLNELSRRRLETLCQTTDGFRIAEEDLRIRGPGELLGTAQHGWPEFRVANLVDDVQLLTAARDVAAQVVRADPRLSGRYAGLKPELRRRYREKVAFIDVG